MKFYADLHIHSHYSRATSKDLNLENLSLWGQLKGLSVIATGDFTHPGWFAELKKKLEPAEEGFFRLKPEYDKLASKNLPKPCEGLVRFVLSAEISNIYKRLDKVRKVHNVIFAPSFAAAEKIQKKLNAIGNLKADGRPILGLDSYHLLEIVLASDPMSFLVPAHIWTPWFSMLGSKGGFDRMEDCFGDLTKHIFAVETGLSSDPPMNWRLGQLDKCVVISNSDAHSAPKLGREANIFDTDYSYRGIYQALKGEDESGFLGTIEFFPEEGKYHFDGHRDCQTRLHPQETRKNKGLCPSCGKPVTVGVMARVEELADHPDGRQAPRAKPYQSLIPLLEIVAEARGVGVNSPNVLKNFMEVISHIGNELYVLREAPLKDIARVGGNLLAEGIRRVREGKVSIAAGYDGEYGTINIFSDAERETGEEQLKLF